MQQKQITTIVMSFVIAASILMTSATPMIPKAEAAHPIFATGDVFVAVGSSSVQWRHPDGTLNTVIDCSSFISSSFTTGMAFDSSGNLYITMFDGDGVCKTDNTGTPIGTFGSFGNNNPESIVFDAAGNAYVGSVDGTDEDIRKFDSAGNLLGNLMQR